MLCKFNFKVLNKVEMLVKRIAYQFNYIKICSENRFNKSKQPHPKFEPVNQNNMEHLKIIYICTIFLYIYIYIQGHYQSPTFLSNTVL